MRRSNFALRLQASLLDELRKIAETEGAALNQLINVPVAEKLSALRTEDYFAERARHANRTETLRILGRAGRAIPQPQAMSFPPAGERPKRKPMSPQLPRWIPLQLASFFVNINSRSCRT
jgi:hypothetical protein